MAHHAYLYAGEQEQGIEQALIFGEHELGLPRTGNPDVLVYRYGLFSIDDARRISDIAALSSVTGDKKLIVLAAERLFHQTQNALLKLFEEPTEGTTLVLIVPSMGIVQGTLRSRLLTLPGSVHGTPVSKEAQTFLEAQTIEREKIVEKLLHRAKSDSEEEKQSVRGEVVRLVEGLLVATHQSLQKKPTEELRLLLQELDTFLPILHERSAPLKLICEHLLLTLPTLSSK